jgi:hypothetical protein
MIITSSPAVTRLRRRALPVRGWRTVIGLAGLLAGAVTVAGCLLPWAEIFAGLIGIPGIRGDNGKALALAGALIAVVGLSHLVTGDPRTRLAIGIIGAGVAGYAGYLLLRLAGSLKSLGSDSMLAVRGGPGLWVVALGGVVAVSTLFLPSASPAAHNSHSEAKPGLLAWADRESTGLRRWVQLALGAVWILDAALQFQPYMFTRGFVTQIIEPAGMGSPAVISQSLMGTGQVLLSHVVIFNAAFATIQLGLGAGLFWRRTTRAALAGTIVWALGVWWLGEGLGGLLTNSASPVTGAPGAALLYVLIAILAWPPARSVGAPADRTTGSIAMTGRAGRYSGIIWALLWAGFAGLVLRTQLSSPGALRQAIASQAGAEPHWYGALDHAAAGAVGSASLAVSITLAIVCLVIAAGIFVPAAVRPVLLLAALTALVLGLVGQDFGGVLTGQGTDPGTGPLLIILAAAYWPLRLRPPSGGLALQVRSADRRAIGLRPPGARIRHSAPRRP